MLVSIIHGLQKRFEDQPAYGMIGELKNIFQCKMTEGAMYILCDYQTLFLIEGYKDNFRIYMNYVMNYG
jgi:hypothetical protein